jgi:hypothetical protein
MYKQMASEAARDIQVPFVLSVRSRSAYAHEKFYLPAFKRSYSWPYHSFNMIASVVTHIKAY